MSTSTSNAFIPCDTTSIFSPPPMPTRFPSCDRSILITGSLLTDTLVADALEYVNQVVEPKYLNYKPSSFIQSSDGTVVYNEDASKTCYWPCTRDWDTDQFRADVVSCPNANDWGLTYDDEPSSDTPALRSALKAAGNITATFFVTGSSIQESPEELRNLYKDGHQIAALTWSHHPLTCLSNAQIVAEFKYTEALIYNTIGVVVKHFRPPYGDIDDRVRAIASALGYRAVMWTTSPSRDCEDTGVDTDSTRILTSIKDTWFKAQPGYICRQHSNTPSASSIAIKVIEEVEKIGLGNLAVKPKTVAACIGDNEWYQHVATPTPTPSSTVLATATGIDGEHFKSSSGSNAANLFFVGFVTLLLVIAAGFLI